MPAQSLFITNGGYGGDFMLSPQGGLVIAQDTDQDATATNQFLARLLLTNSQIQDAAGNVIARGDSLQYPLYGIGVGREVDSTPTTSSLNNLQATIIDQVSQYPRFLRNPAPTVTLKQTDTQTLSIVITYSLNTGQVYTTPDIPVFVGG